MKYLKYLDFMNKLAFKIKGEYKYIKILLKI